MTLLPYLVLGILSGGAQPPARDGIDPCSYVTKAEVETTLRHAVAKTTSHQRDGLTSCAYMARQQRWPVARIDVVTLADVAQARELFGWSRQTPEVQPVRGVGEDAVWSPRTQRLTILKEKYVLGILVSTGLDAAKTLAAAALPRLR